MPSRRVLLGFRQLVIWCLPLAPCLASACATVLRPTAVNEPHSGGKRALTAAQSQHHAPRHSRACGSCFPGLLEWRDASRAVGVLGQARRCHHDTRQRPAAPVASLLRQLPSGAHQTCFTLMKLRRFAATDWQLHSGCLVVAPC